MPIVSKPLYFEIPETSFRTTLSLPVPFCFVSLVFLVLFLPYPLYLRTSDLLALDFCSVFWPLLWNFCTVLSLMCYLSLLHLIKDNVFWISLVCVWVLVQSITRLIQTWMTEKLSWCNCGFPPHWFRDRKSHDWYNTFIFRLRSLLCVGTLITLLTESKCMSSYDVKEWPLANLS